MINFLNISKQDMKIKNKIINKISNIIKLNSFINGKEVKTFEKNFAIFCSTKYCVTVANGTDALIIALKSLGLKKNDEVIIPAMTWKSTFLAAHNLGLSVKLVDIEKDGTNLDISKLKKKISKKTKAIIAVHLYGNPANLSEIKQITKKRGIHIIEDAAQAHGAIDYSSKKKIGSMTDLACFSFYPGKNLGAYGDAGCIVTNNAKLEKKIRMIKNLGSLGKYDCEVYGLNSRMDTIQAAVLNLKLEHLKNLNLKRVKIAKYYVQNLKNRNIKIINYNKGSVYHQFIIISKLKQKIIKILKKNKIEYGEHYPISINNLKITKNKYSNQKFPNAEKLAKYGLSLPIDPNLTKKDIKKIIILMNKIR